MRMYDIIMKKRNGGELTEEEIQFFVNGFTRGVIPDYQAAALMMAIYFEKMTGEETYLLTMAMGREGSITRLAGELFGSAITFCSLEKASAPGQVQVKQAIRIMDDLHEVFA